MEVIKKTEDRYRLKIEDKEIIIFGKIANNVKRHIIGYFTDENGILKTIHRNSILGKTSIQVITKYNSGGKK